MKSQPKIAVSIDEYIAAFPEETQIVLEEIRTFIKKIVPDAEETISYAIPTFKLNGTYLVYFAAFKTHIGFYPTPVGMEAFKDRLSAYKTGKGSVQFPLNKPMPFELIHDIVQFRLSENLEQQTAKKKKRT